jgi:hypothetical protein
MKADKNYRMSKMAKKFLASIWDKDHRNLAKRMTIDAEVTYEHAKRTAGKTREKSAAAE